MARSARTLACSAAWPAVGLLLLGLFVVLLAGPARAKAEAFAR